MKRSFLFLMLAGAALAAGEFDFKNAVFDLTFDTKGGTVRKLLYKNLTMLRCRKPVRALFCGHGSRKKANPPNGAEIIDSGFSIQPTRRK